jgi:endonuclease-3
LADKNLKDYGQRVLKILESALVGKVPEPMSITLIKEYGPDPFLILIACLLSLRSRDTVTYGVSRELFKRARTPQEILAIPEKELEAIIHKIGFFRRKATILKEVSQQLIDQFHGKVPDTEADLLRIKGVGRKTANLVLPLAFHKPAICVDVHVQRLSNKLGLVDTKTPEQTERALQKIFPQSQWTTINRLLVMLGQNMCTPTSSNISICHPIEGLPIAVGVKYKT